MINSYCQIILLVSGIFPKGAREWAPYCPLRNITCQQGFHCLIREWDLKLNVVIQKWMAFLFSLIMMEKMNRVFYLLKR
ncbi:hypothetical protein EEL32_06340 [Brevibacillus laterosporus]|nr:hypothetical protein EEL32_06340 [Brevibacillus laterosporus]